MPYIQRANLDAAYGALQVSNLIDSDDLILEEALTATDDRINTILSARYVVPFGILPTSLIWPGVYIAWYFLWRRNQEEPEAVLVRYKEALDMLNRYAMGIVPLVGATLRSELVAPKRIFIYDDDFSKRFTL